MRYFREELELFERESWGGLSGGRSEMVEVLRALGALGGSSMSGNPFRPLESWLVEKEDEIAGERVASGPVPTVAERSQIPDMTAGVQIAHACLCPWTRTGAEETHRVDEAS